MNGVKCEWVVDWAWAYGEGSNMIDYVRTECGEEFDINPDEAGKFKFCPACGAKIEKVEVAA